MKTEHVRLFHNSWRMYTRLIYLCSSLEFYNFKQQFFDRVLCRKSCDSGNSDNRTINRTEWINCARHWPTACNLLKYRSSNSGCSWKWSFRWEEIRKQLTGKLRKAISFWIRSLFVHDFCVCSPVVLYKRKNWLIDWCSAHRASSWRIGCFKIIAAGYWCFSSFNIIDSACCASDHSQLIDDCCGLNFQRLDPSWLLHSLNDSLLIPDRLSVSSLRLKCTWYFLSWESYFDICFCPKHF